MSCHPERNRAERGEVEGSAVAFASAESECDFAGSLSIRCAILVVLCLFAGTAPSFCKTPTALRSSAIDVQIIGVHPNPDDARDLIVSVQVTIRAADQPLVVPNCAEDSSLPAFCVARLSRSNGKVIQVRRRLAAELGVEPYEHWKPVTIAPRTEQRLKFNYSTGLLDVGPGEPVRVRFEVWPNPEAMNHWKSATTFLTPIFRNPTKAN